MDLICLLGYVIMIWLLYPFPKSLWYIIGKLGLKIIKLFINMEPCEQIEFNKADLEFELVHYFRISYLSNSYLFYLPSLFFNFTLRLRVSSVESFNLEN
jgi:hypothetical protein